METQAKTIRVTREGNGTYELTLRPEWTDGEPRVRDLDLATWLEFKDPHKVRALIRRHLGRIKPVSATVAETSPKGGRPGTEFYLTEREALFIASQSKTPKALDVTQRVIDVFVLVRRQAMQPPALPPPPAPKALPPSPAPGRLCSLPRWPELRLCAQMATRHRLTAEHYEIAGQFAVPAALVSSPALIDDLAELAMRHRAYGRR